MARRVASLVWTQSEVGLPRLLPALLQHLLLEAGRLPRLPLGPVGRREVVHGRQRVGMLVAQDPPALLQHLLLEAGRLPRLPLGPIGRRAVVHARQRGGMVVAQDPP